MSNALSVEESLFFAALEMHSAAQRNAYLDAACGESSEVRFQVEKLLRAHSKLGVFLNRPAVEQYAEAVDPTTEQSVSESTHAGVNTPVGEEDSVDFLQPSSLPDSLGRMGEYEVQEVLGRGGFGIVFRGFDQKLQRPVAIKVLAPQLAASESARRRFLAEARSSANIRHANVVQIYGIAEQPLPYLVMELIPGETLQQRLQRVGRLDFVEVATIGRQVAEGLAASHRLGLVHRDVKPGNILLESGDGDSAEGTNAKIGDFGLARAADDASISHYGIVAGTPMYMAPEQALGETLDQRADLFALGSVLYTMCVGQPPFRGKNTFAVLRQVAEHTPRPVGDLVPETPQWLCEIITRLHAKNPDDRFASAKEVAGLLSAHLSALQHPDVSRVFTDTVPATQESISVAPISSAGPAGMMRRGWTVAAAMLLLILGGVGLTEATGITALYGTVVELFTSSGTLVVQVDDPQVSVKLDGEELVITGAGAKEVRLRPGHYQIEASKDGELLRRELVTVTNNGRRVVHVSQGPPTSGPKDAEQPGDEFAWERSVADLPADEQRAAVEARLIAINPGIEGFIEKPTFDVHVFGSKLHDITPLRAMRGLKTLWIYSDTVTDISPLKGVNLTRFDLSYSKVSDLSPLQGMPLEHLDLSGSKNVVDLSPLRGLPLEEITIAYTGVSDLTPLSGMKLRQFNCDSCNVKDLSPLKGLPLTNLMVHRTKVSDFAPIKGMPLQYLNCDGTVMGDKDLVYLNGCRNLTFLSLVATNVTAAGIQQLHQTLPGCRIRWDGVV
ncbi:MAG: protein kinase, partial [Planctomycetales bacterium]|nr:protein kinase [Planctomycetales bacterium]